MLLPCLCLLILCIVGLYYRLRKKYTYWGNLNVPHEKPVLIFGNLGSFVFKKIPLVELVVKWYNTHASERYFGIYQFLKPCLVVKDIGLIKCISTTDFHYFSEHSNVVDNRVDPLFAKSLLFLKGEEWKNMRTCLSAAFTSLKMKAMMPLMSECAAQFCNHFVKECSKSGGQVDCEMKDAFSRFANDVIASTAFGSSVDSMANKDNEFFRMGSNSMKMNFWSMLKVIGYSVTPGLMRVFGVKRRQESVSDFFRSLVKTSISIRQTQHIERPDLIHLLMQYRKKNHLDDDDITAQALMFFLAGFDTASTLLSFLSHELAINPKIQGKLQKEIDTSFGTSVPTYDQIMSMEYLDMVIQEALRKWPTGSIMERMCTKDYVIRAKSKSERDLTIKAGTMIWIPIFALQRDEAFVSSPEEFLPERFEGGKASFPYIPFGAGPRSCLGNRFALLEIKVLLVYLLKKFTIEPNERTQIPIRIAKSQFKLNAEKGYWLSLKARK